MNKLAIIHFQPLELYPPVQNVINEISENKLSQIKAFVYSTNATQYYLPFFKTAPSVSIKRYGRSGNNLSNISRYFNYLVFWINCLVGLVKNKPKRILYYETNSFLPVFLYTKMFNPRVEILAHYHEYTSLNDYKQNRLNNYLHKLERRMYNKFKWISHTNSYRVDLFLNEHPEISLPVKAVPNFPPQKWIINREHSIESPVKIVYVGALSTTTMYLENFVNWVKGYSGQIIIDFYSINASEDAKAYLEKINEDFIHLYPGVEYHELPEILRKYDIGVILYKGHVKNYVYNAPNKLFEYLAAGLDVWFPNEMTGSLPYISDKSYPKIVSLDFNKLNSIDTKRLIDRKGLALKKNCYSAEQANEELMTAFLRKENG